MIMRSPKNRFEQFIRNKIYLKDDTNCMIGIVDFYDGSNDYKIHKESDRTMEQIREQSLLGREESSGGNS